MMTRKLPADKYLHECFEYNPETGQMFWKIRPRKHFSSDRGWNSWNAKHAGNQAFTSRNTAGHMHSTIDYVLCTAHRVIWKWMTGQDPANQIDHRNRNRADNRWKNLREATGLENARNRTLQKNNTSGNIGVYFHKPTKKWKAAIGANKKQIHLGTFDSEAEAIQARSIACQLYHGEFTPQ